MIKVIVGSVCAAAAAALITFAGDAGAVILTPGVVTPLPGTTVAADPSLAGTIVQDVLSPFTVHHDDADGRHDGRNSIARCSCG